MICARCGWPITTDQLYTEARRQRRETPMIELTRLGSRPVQRLHIAPESIESVEDHENKSSN